MLCDEGTDRMKNAPIKVTETDALVVVDVQNDFLPGGALAVADGDAVIAPVNKLVGVFPHIVMTQDWHAPGHISFASSHPGKTPFAVITVGYGDQILWPDHCVQGSKGAEFSPQLEIPKAELIIRKGYHRDIDSYSGFVEADRHTHTGLAGYLKERGFQRVFIAGLATDFCVAWTAIDAVKAGFEVVVIEDACRGIDTNGSLKQALADMNAAGVQATTSGDLLG